MTSTLPSPKSKCDGLGECITQCGCGCYDDEECNIPSEICICEHKDHKVRFVGGTTDMDNYCRIDCDRDCKLKPCPNYQLCGRSLPEWVLLCHEDLCPDCAMTIGEVKFHNKISECPICLEDGVVIACKKNRACMECLKKPLFEILGLVDQIKI